MAIPSSGTISFTTIQTEFGGSNPIGLSEYYAGGGLVPAGTSGTNGPVPSSGAISVANFYGTSAVTVPTAPTIGTATATGTSTATVSYTASSSNGGATITSYTAISSPGSITGSLATSGSGTITVSGLSANTFYTFKVYATNSVGNSPQSASSNGINTFANAGQDLYTTPGLYTWVAPAGVSLASIFVVGAGGGGGRKVICGCYLASGNGGGGGGSGYATNYAVSAGAGYQLRVGLRGTGGAGYGPTCNGYSKFDSALGGGCVVGVGGPYGTVGYSAGAIFSTNIAGGNGWKGCGTGCYTSGGNGGFYNTALAQGGAGGGGAGGYTANGGTGSGNTTGATTSSGGGGGGGGRNNTVPTQGGGGGGGVGMFGLGSNGSAGTTGSSPTGGGGGSGGTSGCSPTNVLGRAGGNYGGGGGGSGYCGSGCSNPFANGGNGAVRVIWATTASGITRNYPSTNTGNM